MSVKLLSDIVTFVAVVLFLGAGCLLMFLDVGPLLVLGGWAGGLLLGCLGSMLDDLSVRRRRRRA